MSPITIKIVVYLLLTFIACFFYFENFKAYKNSKRIFIGLIILLAFSFGVYDIINTATDSKKDKQDILDAVKSAVDSMRKDEYDAHQRISDALQQNQGDIRKSLDDLKTTPTQKTIPYARIRFDFATISKTNKEDSIQFDYKIINEGNSKAFGLKFFNLVGMFMKGKFFVLPKRSIDSYSSNVGIYPGDESRKAVTTYLNITGIPKDSIFYCIKMDFTDSSKTKKSSIKIYHINTIKMYVEDVLLETDNRIMHSIISYKFWKTPFGQ